MTRRVSALDASEVKQRDTAVCPPQKRPSSTPGSKQHRHLWMGSTIDLFNGFTCCSPSYSGCPSVMGWRTTVRRGLSRGSSSLRAKQTAHLNPEPQHRTFDISLSDIFVVLIRQCTFGLAGDPGTDRSYVMIPLFSLAVVLWIADVWLKRNTFPGIHIYMGVTMAV